jgi:hypothetical protein
MAPKDGICDPTPRNESLRAFKKSEKKGKNSFFSIHDVFCQNSPIALQACYNINADWHTFFLEAIALPLF